MLDVLGHPPAPPAPQGAPHLLASLWTGLGLPPAALDQVTLTGPAAVLPSSFAVTVAAQASVAAAGLAAWLALDWRAGAAVAQRSRLRVDSWAAARLFGSHLQVDGQTPPVWDPVSGLYPCGQARGAPGWVRVHANFAHHRDRLLALLGLPTGALTPREAVAAALAGWSAPALEAALMAAGGVGVALRTPAQWAVHPQAVALAARQDFTLPVQVRRLPTPPGQPEAPPRRWPALQGPHAPPWQGLRVLDFSRILAGPVAGRALAWLGAEVLLVNGPHLPNIAVLPETSRGKRSAVLDLRAPGDAQRLRTLVAGAHVWLQAYRPGALEARGWTAEALTRLRPGLVVARLSAWGQVGPWAQQRGFDSLVQSALGLNHEEAEAAGQSTPRALPVQVLDHAAGHLLALGTQVALWRQQQEGGSWTVDVSLAGVGQWLRQLGRTPRDLALPPLSPEGHWQDEASGFGPLRVMPSAWDWSAPWATPWRPAVPPGTDAPVWASAP
ncbi:CoA transferase [Ideonella livida]|uniref:CoA transferase n=1 Tax=Ideonella livida TaxID=2707176 RepID=A0A7C9PEH1_9BURK|nr:CoA transferase [Ideonella livida]NDY89853.1 CoA transferase [Ideonella livida]